MITSKPLVSVVMPNYNTPEEYLREAVESVLRQTYARFEFIIVDDASTGSDIEIIGSYDDDRIILLRNEKNMHVSHSLNRGMERAQGAYIARMDSDDVCLPDRLEKQVRFMEQRKDIDVLCSRVRMFGNKNGVFSTGIKEPEHMKVAVFFGNPVMHPSVMFRASFLREHSVRYSTDAKYKAAEDYELWARCAFAGRIYEYPQVLLKYRMHAGQVSTATRNLQDTNANHVRRNMLERLGIVPDPREVDVHFNLCVEVASPGISLSETESWARGLLRGNKQHRVFDARCFKREICRHFLVVAVKALLQKQVTPGRLMGMRMTRKMLYPANYPGYIKRYLFSKRLNRLQ